MPIYKQTTEITNIDDLLSNVERDIEEIYFGDKQVFTVWATYDDTLPAQYTANGSMLADYRVYGAAGGVGDETANIYDCADMSYGYEGGRSLNADGTTSINSNWCISSYIEVNPSTAYTINWYVGIPYPSFLCEYDENYNFIGSISEGLNKTFTTSSQTKYLRLSNTYRAAERSRRETCVLVEGSTAPAAYVPYGYVIPISVSDGTTSTTTPIYIGDEPLNANGGYTDYVDYQSQKIKRRIKTRIFDGSETFTLQTTNIYALPITGMINDDLSIAYSSNYYTWWQWIINGAQFNSAPDKSLFGFRNYSLYIKDTDYASVANFKNHVKELYDAGTPLTVTYVTSEYYDTDPPVPLPALPTVDGTTIMSYAGQSIEPSEFYTKYRKQNF